MQNATAEWNLAFLDRDLIENTVRELLERRKNNDIDGMLEFADENIVYEVRGSRKLYPLAGRRTGINEMRRILKQVAIEYINIDSKIHRIVIDGNEVAVERTATLQHVGTGVVADVDIVNFLRFDRGLVVEISEHADARALDYLQNAPAADETGAPALADTKAPETP